MVQVQVQDFAEGKNIIGKNWITRFLNRHPILSIKSASHTDRQPAYASNPHIVDDHFTKLGKVLRTNRFTPEAITNVDEKGFIMGVAPRTRVTCRGKKNPRVKQDGKRVHYSIGSSFRRWISLSIMPRWEGKYAYI